MYGAHNINVGVFESVEPYIIPDEENEAEGEDPPG